MTSRGTLALLMIVSLGAPDRAFAWGERGHNAIARVAAMRVLEGVDLSRMTEGDKKSYLALRDYFRGKALQLGHIANVPDIYWRKLGDEVEALNAPTHFSNADEWTDDISSLPLEYRAAKDYAAKKKNKVDGKAIELFDNGTVIWRAEQLFDKMIGSFKKAKSEEPGSKEFKTDIQDALVYGGLMAHFVGDASQPYHNTIDHDGYAAGEGGIHSYFETAALNVETPALELDVYDQVPDAYRAVLKKSKFDDDSECEKLAAACLTRALSAQALARVPDVRKADASLVLEPSHDKIAAKRKSPDEAAPAFRPIIEEQLALSAAALARLWREAWERGGKPDLSTARSFDYALTPAFVEPDYDPDAVARIRTAAGHPSQSR